MKKNFAPSLIFLLLLPAISISAQEMDSSWIRINQLGYTPAGVKVAVWGSKHTGTITSFQLMDAVSKKRVFSTTAGKQMGAYGPFVQTYRLNFSAFRKPGKYYLQAGKTKSPEFEIG